jgi:AAA15 family ATPase/GTPase
MIQQLSISNFKSIKHLEMPCKKLNIIIGEPNSGKSNIIEALCLQSQNAVGQELSKQMFRYKSIGDLFYDFNINQPIVVKTDAKETILKFAMREDGVLENEFHFMLNTATNTKQPTTIGHDGIVNRNGDNNAKTNTRYYEFKRLTSFSNSYMPHLTAPYGENLPNLLLANQEHKKWVADFFQAKGFLLTLKPTENELALSKMVDNEIYSYPYFTISETLQRVVFYCMAIKTSQDAVLLLDEPESNTFPFYTKYLAERIALDETNQFFITTHNPYLLLSLIEKTPIKDLNVCIAEMKNYETILHILNEKQITKVLDFNSDVFFNFNQIIAE